jgi:hypothetical protein
MKQITLSMLSIIFVICYWQGIAAAHVLKEDHGIAAILHMPPDDNPVAGQQTELDFSFGDDAQRFSLQTCDCTVSVKHNSQLIQKSRPKPAVSNAPLDGIVMANFPQTGVYDVVVDGHPNNSEFQAFQLTYTVRVATAANNATGKGSEILIIGAGSLAILVLVAYNNIQSGGRYAMPPPKPRAKIKAKS